MKTLFLSLVALYSAKVFSQDTLYLKSGEAIICEILEVTNSGVTYTSWGKNFPKSIELNKISRAGSKENELVNKINYPIPSSNFNPNSFIGENTSSSMEIYCLLLGTEKFLSNKVIVQVDFGQGINKWRPKESVLRDEETGQMANFNSMIDALNYMAQRGWTFVNAYAITIGNQNVYHWLLKKEITE